ncbi:type VI secretion system baseplate subunit TssG [Caulobacter sp. KR2-114]|uniref:type VI secretion system baseplate subunit TssG n=1 Tax=Caulobacter sp. KR2-114 TaxID=3400912 RepID=UPI003C127F58
MATESRGPDASLIEALETSPERFELVQAVRILERAAALAGGAGSGRVGGDADPRDEAVRLRAAPDLGFPAAELAGYEAGEGRPALSVTALGLNGPSGVLPYYYSEMVLEAQRGRNGAMRDFLDIFNHRSLSLFVRAAEKYRIAQGFERCGGSAEDPISGVLYALVGLGEPSLRGRLAAPDNAIAYYAGLYAHQPRTSEGLAQILSDYFEQPAVVHQFKGSWGFLPPQEQTRLTSGPTAGAFSQLGVDSVCGSRVFDVQSAFRISLGPMSYEAFMAFLPGSPQMAALNALTRVYVGPALVFDVQLILAADEIPPLSLARDVAGGARLGWNTWLPTSGAREDAADAVFDGEAA